VRRLRVVIGAVLAPGLGAAAGRGPAAPPTCAAGVIGDDLDEFGGSALVATHTIQVTTDFGSTRTVKLQLN
jgi:hypothetical protein